MREPQLLEKWLRENGISNGELAEKLQVTRQNISYHLNSEAAHIPESFKKKLAFAGYSIPEIDVKPLDNDLTKPYVRVEGLPVSSNETGFRILPILVDSHDEERIAYVDIKAQAGYALQCTDPMYIKQLPSFSLPFGRFNRGTYRAYEVEGDSMNETLDEGDVLICSPIEPEYWKNIKNGYIYVVIFDSQCLVKRVLKEGDVLTLLSDNETYAPQQVHLNEVKELWYMHRAFKWRFSPPNNVEKQLAAINKKLDSLIKK